MRKSAFAGLFALAFVAIAGPAPRAQAQDLSQFSAITVEASKPQVIASLDAVRMQQQAEAKQEEKVEPPVNKYVVAEGDSLHKIAEAHQLDWKRLFYKNVTIENPNIITVGSEIIIPTAEETLEERPIPEPVADVPVVAAPTQKASTASTRTTTQTRGTSSGNTYSPGYCTWYAKNMRPDLPNNLGNADTWVSRAAAQGLPTGSTPQVGAIGQQGMHVVYVQSVNGDGTVTVSEMNYNGLYVVSTRTVPASTFRYIY